MTVIAGLLVGVATAVAEPAGAFCAAAVVIPQAVAIPRMAGRRLATAYRFGLYPGTQIQPSNEIDAMYPSRQTGSVKTTAKRMIRPPITAKKANRDCGSTVRAAPARASPSPRAARPFLAGAKRCRDSAVSVPQTA
jgi:hypothetical protein